MSKAWSYKAITKAAEAALRRERRLIKRCLLEREPDFRRFDLLSFGNCQGIFCLWNDITMGWQSIPDKERLEGLWKTFAVPEVEKPEKAFFFRITLKEKGGVSGVPEVVSIWAETQECALQFARQKHPISDSEEHFFEIEFLFMEDE